MTVIRNPAALALKLLLATTFLLAFEQILLLFLNIDTELKPYRIFVILTLIVCINLSNRFTPIARGICTLLIIIFALGAALASFWVVVKGNGIGVLIHALLLLSFGVSLFWCTLVSVKHPDHVERLLKCIVYSFIVSSLIWYLFISSGESYRVSGLFRNPNQFGYLVSVSILISIHFLFKRGQSKYSIYLVAIFAGIYVLLLTGSRTAIFSLIPISLLMIARHLRLGRRNSGIRTISVVLLIVVSTTIVLVTFKFDGVSDRLLDRFASENVSTAAGRLDIWRAGILAAKDHLFIGMGIGQYNGSHLHYIGQLQAEVYSTVEEFELGLQSEYMTMFVEFGILGLALYGILLVRVWGWIRRAAKYDLYTNDLSKIMEALLLLDIVFSLSRNMYIFPYHWLVLGICVAYIEMVEKRFLMLAKNNTNRELESVSGGSSTSKLGL